MSEPTKFRSEAEARAWDGYAAAFAAGVWACPDASQNSQPEAISTRADALLAERRKREGAREVTFKGEPVIEVLAALALDVHRFVDGNGGAASESDFPCLGSADAIVAEARRVK